MNRNIIFFVLFVVETPCPVFSETYESSIEDTACAAAAPEPILLPNSYKEQKFTRSKDNQAIESAAIDSDTKIEISYSGCADGAEQKFTFLVKSQAGKDSDLVYWSAFARKKITSLKIKKGEAWVVKSLSKFLEKVPTYEVKDNKVDVCVDDTIPGIDGCGFESGGSYSFELSQMERCSV
jgi:hypothetical protein